VQCAARGFNFEQGSILRTDRRFSFALEDVRTVYRLLALLEQILRSLA
jgi:hypothetical protein